MSIRNPKQALYEQFAIVAKALGHPQRLELIEHLAQGPRSVERCWRRSSACRSPTSSQHLQTTAPRGPGDGGARGKFVNYRLADDSVLSLLCVGRGRLPSATSPRSTASSAAISKLATTWSRLHARSCAERMRDGLVTVIDVRRGRVRARPVPGRDQRSARAIWKRGSPKSTRTGDRGLLPRALVRDVL